jgi:hypothetical protein
LDAEGRLALPNLVLTPVRAEPRRLRGCRRIRTPQAHHLPRYSTRCPPTTGRITSVPSLELMRLFARQSTPLFTDTDAEVSAGSGPPGLRSLITRPNRGPKCPRLTEPPRQGHHSRVGCRPRYGLLPTRNTSALTRRPRSAYAGAVEVVLPEPEPSAPAPT